MTRHAPLSRRMRPLPRFGAEPGTGKDGLTFRPAGAADGPIRPKMSMSLTVILPQRMTEAISAQASTAQSVATFSLRRMENDDAGDPHACRRRFRPCLKADWQHDKQDHEPDDGKQDNGREDAHQACSSSINVPLKSLG